MKYIYTKEKCSACKSLKKEYKEKGVEYVERDGSRLESSPPDLDDIDRDAMMIMLNKNEKTFPVVVDTDDNGFDLFGGK